MTYILFLLIFHYPCKRQVSVKNQCVESDPQPLLPGLSHRRAEHNWSHRNDASHAPASNHKALIFQIFQENQPRQSGCTHQEEELQNRANYALLSRKHNWSTQTHALPLTDSQDIDTVKRQAAEMSHFQINHDTRQYTHIHSFILFIPKRQAQASFRYQRYANKHITHLRVHQTSSLHHRCVFLPILRFFPVHMVETPSSLAAAMHINCFLRKLEGFDLLAVRFPSFSTTIRFVSYSKDV